MKIILFLFCLVSLQVSAHETVTFEAEDGVLVTADYYHLPQNKKAIVLFHQAGYSRGEYIETAKELLGLGFNCLAVDLRSGDKVRNTINETHKDAVSKKKATTYVDAIPDMKAAIKFLSKKEGKRVDIMGSSYSASLVLLVGKEHPSVSRIIAFSPGEYLKGIELKESIQDLKKPTFVTCASAESAEVMALVDGLKTVVLFRPKVKGIHGSRALWKSTEGNDTYWSNLTRFLRFAE